MGFLGTGLLGVVASTLPISPFRFASSCAKVCLKEQALHYPFVEQAAERRVVEIRQTLMWAWEPLSREEVVCMGGGEVQPA